MLGGGGGWGGGGAQLHVRAHNKLVCYQPSKSTWYHVNVWDLAR